MQMLEASCESETIAKKGMDLGRIIATNNEVAAFLWPVQCKSRKYEVSAYLER